jgi:hypothetical protein
MSLIFDNFPSRSKAESFVAAIHQEFGLEGQVFDDEESAFENDWFPYRLYPPIVHIDRPEELELEEQIRVEQRIEDRVTEFAGTFAGT